MGYCSVKEGNEVLTHATTLMNLQRIMLNERNQSLIQLHIVLVHSCEIQNRQVYKGRKWVSDYILGLGENEE